MAGGQSRRASWSVWNPASEDQVEGGGVFTACGGGAKNRGWWEGGPVHHNEGKGGYHVILLDLESVSFAASDT